MKEMKAPYAHPHEGFLVWLAGIMLQSSQFVPDCLLQLQAARDIIIVVAMQPGKPSITDQED
ncbi:MAG: hypothetical protein ACETWB_03575 [Anaerolineae bacterium]